MAVTTTNRFGLYRWSADSDSILREHMDLSHAAIENFGAKVLFGSSPPATGSAEYARTFFFNTSNNKFYYYTAEDNTGSWVVIETDVILVTLADNKGDILVATGPDQWDILPIGTVNQVLTVADNEGNVVWATILTSKGDLLTLNETGLVNLNVGTDAQVLIADSGTSTGLRWGLADTPSIENSAVNTQKFFSGSVDNSKIADAAIVASDIGNLAVTTPKIVDSAVTEAAIQNLAVAASKIANSGITEIKISDNSVTATKFAPSSVTAQKIFNLAVTSSRIGNLAVTTSKFADLAVSASKIASNSVVSSIIANNAVTTLKVFNDAVTTSRIADGSVASTSIADLNVTTPKIIDLAVGNAQFAPQAVTAAKINDLAVTTSVIANNSAIRSKFDSSSVTTPKINDDAVTTEKIALDAVDNAAIRPGAGLSVIGNSGSVSANVADVVAATDHTVFQRLSGSVGFSSLARESIIDGAVTTPKIADLTIVDADISATAGLTLTKLADGTFPSAITTSTDNYLSRSVTVSKLHSQKTADGVGVWRTYVPNIYFDMNQNYDFNTNSIKENLPEFPGIIIDPIYYTLHYAKYMKLNGFVLAKVRITLNENWDPLYGGGALPQAPGVASPLRTVAIGLPVMVLNPDHSCIGSGYFFNANNSTLQQRVTACSFASPSLAYFMTQNEPLGDQWIYSPYEYPYINYTNVESNDMICMNVQYAAEP